MQGIGDHQGILAQMTFDQLCFHGGVFGLEIGPDPTLCVAGPLAQQLLATLANPAGRCRSARRTA